MSAPRNARFHYVQSSNDDWEDIVRSAKPGETYKIRMDQMVKSKKQEVPAKDQRQRHSRGRSEGYSKPRSVPLLLHPRCKECQDPHERHRPIPSRALRYEKKLPAYTLIAACLASINHQTMHVRVIRMPSGRAPR